jgi:hypothetical protein
MASSAQVTRYDVRQVTSGPRSGSVPAHLRNAFLDLIENEARGDEACLLAEQLSECTDVLPFEHCEMLELPAGSTFAQAAEAVRASLGCQP